MHTKFFDTYRHYLLVFLGFFGSTRFFFFTNLQKLLPVSVLQNLFFSNLRKIMDEFDIIILAASSSDRFNKTCSVLKDPYLISTANGKKYWRSATQ